MSLTKDNGPLFAVLRNRGFRLLWCANLLSDVGLWVQNLALGWLTAQHRHAALLLGVLGFVSLAPVLVVSVVGGALADRIDRRKILVCCQIVFMVIALALAGLTWYGLIQWWHIVIASALTGCAVAMNSPAYQALIGDLVTRDELPRAVALNSVQFNVARIVGHAAAGLAIVAISPAGCFLINALSYLAMLFALLRMDVASGHRRADSVPLLVRAREGLAYVYTRPELLKLILTVGCISLLGLPYFFLLPQFGRDVIHTGARGLGFLTASVSVGGLLGGLLVTRLSGRFGQRPLLLAASLLFWLHLLGFALSRNLILSSMLLAGLGFYLVITLATVNSILQLGTPPDVRGRVMSILSLASKGLAPVGSLVAGSLAAYASAPIAVAAMSVAGAAAATVLWRSSRRESACFEGMPRVETATSNTQ
jgi:MFS family permease